MAFIQGAAEQSTIKGHFMPVKLSSFGRVHRGKP